MNAPATAPPSVHQPSSASPPRPFASRASRSLTVSSTVCSTGRERRKAPAAPRNARAAGVVPHVWESLSLGLVAPLRLARREDGGRAATVHEVRAHGLGARRVGPDRPDLRAPAAQRQRLR